MFFQLLDDDISFPNPRLADEDGLLAIGGDLSVERLLLAYSNGIFPWFSEADPILWYAPHQRCVIFPHKINVSKSTQKIIDKNRFKVTINQAFSQVVRKCAETIRPGQDAYFNLHQKGYASSIEVWRNSVLVGGLYGVKINRVFCGESMFSEMSNASKIALIALSKMDFDLIDCQLPNDHLINMGAEMISYDQYIGFLQAK